MLPAVVKIAQPSWARRQRSVSDYRLDQELVCCDPGKKGGGPQREAARRPIVPEGEPPQRSSLTLAEHLESASFLPVPLLLTPAGCSLPRHPL